MGAELKVSWSIVVGLGKLSTSDTEALSDPEVLQRLTDKVSSAMDEAASTLLRIKAEQQKTAPA